MSVWLGKSILQIHEAREEEQMKDLKEVEAGVAFDDNGDVVVDDGYEVMVDDKTGDRYKCVVAVDWKESPDEVMAAVNRHLKDIGVDVEYVSFNDGSDCYSFGTKI